jgi:diguanylate cyclase (GGDEF)-like protein
MVDVLRGRFGESAVTTASSLSEVTAERVRACNLVLTEWRLPDAKGAAVLERLRELGAAAIIVVTDANCGVVASEAVLCGAADYIVRYGDYLTTLPLVIEKNLVVDQLRQERDALHRQLREQNETLEMLLHSLEEAASTDALTGLYNRRHFARVLEQMFASAVRSGDDLACVMMDMDGFKPLNDTYGHQTGDAALVAAARIMQENLRKTDAAARYGGDEFVLLLARSHAQDAAEVARRIQSAYVEHMKRVGIHDPRVGISYGVATLHLDRVNTADQLISIADTNLYRAKRLTKIASVARVAG